MSFPYSYKTKIDHTENLNFDFWADKIVQKSEKFGLKELAQTQNQLSFVSNKSLFGFKYRVDFFEEDDFLQYEFHLLELIKITLIVVVLLAFVSKFSFSGFLWFAGIFIAVFYFANVFYIGQKLKYFFDNEIFETHLQTIKPEKMTDEQQSWQANSNKCSACGEEITDYDHACPECGLTIKGKRKILPVSTSKFEGYRFRYEYKN